MSLGYCWQKGKMKKSTQDLISVKKIKTKPYIMHNVYDYMNAIKTIEKQTLSLEHELSEEIYVWGKWRQYQGRKKKRKDITFENYVMDSSKLAVAAPAKSLNLYESPWNSSRTTRQQNQHAWEIFTTRIARFNIKIQGVPLNSHFR